MKKFLSVDYDCFYKSAGLISVHLEEEFGGWSFHLFPRKEFWVWGREIDYCFGVQFWGLGPLFLVAHI